MQNCSVAILGVTSLVGQEFVKILGQRDFPMASIRLLSFDHQGGRKVLVGSREVEVQDVGPDSFHGVDIAFFAAGAEASNHLAPLAIGSGATVVDCSAAFRMVPGVPMVVPEVNPEDIKSHRGIIANPNCSVIPLAVALAPLHRVNPIKRIVVASYHAVSCSGAAAIEELMTQTRHILDGQSAIPHVYPHQIAFNVLPETDVFLDNGYTKEEWKIVEETRKILHSDNIAISATCVRVPVVVGLGEAVHVDLSQPMSAEDAHYILAQAPGIKLLDDPAISLYPHPWSSVGTDEVFVGRVHRDESHPNGLVLWVVTDNLRKGAALNAVQVAEEMLKRDWLKSRRSKNEKTGTIVDSHGDPVQ